MSGQQVAVERLKALHRQLHAIATAPASAEQTAAPQHSSAIVSTPNVEMVTMAQERANATFDVRQMTYLLGGGERKTKLRELAQTLVERDHRLMKKNFFDLTLPESREKTMAQIRRFVEIRRRLLPHDPELYEAFHYVMNIYDRSFGMRFYVHDTLFKETISTQGTKEQWLKYKDDIENVRIFGCFGMTELGHSSFLRGLETTATYDKTTQEFVIHTPTLTATKWWIGGAAQTATHAVVLCRLVIDDRSCGTFWFVVQLRCPQTGALLPGVSIGDLGPKYGRSGTDNGWIQFTHVRVPREAMLMRWAQVSPAGEFTESPNAALSYNTLVGERIVALAGAFDAIGQAVTIAVRYGAVRRQGAGAPQLLDFSGYRQALLPVVAGAYAVHVVTTRLRAGWAECLRLAESRATEAEFLRRLPDYHALSSGLKAWVGWWAADALEACRRATGGHGYSAYNAIPGLIADFAVMTTGGGDNAVLAQQHARYLLKAFRRATSGRSDGVAAESSVAFVNPQNVQRLATGQPRLEAATPEQLGDTTKILAAFEWLTVALLKRAGVGLAAAISGGDKSASDAWNENLMDLLECSRAHTYWYIIKVFGEVVDTAPEDAEARGVKGALRQLHSLFALTLVTKVLPLLLEHGYVQPEQVAMVRSQVYALCRAVRVNAVALVDAFNYPDFILKAPIGAKDGDIYNRYFRVVNDAPNAHGKPHYWEKEIAPLQRDGNE